LINWSAWQSVGTASELLSPNRTFIRYRVTLFTNNTTITPKLYSISLHDIPRNPYEQLGFSRPVMLDKNGVWEAVLENAYDIIVKSEVNG